MQQPAIVIVEDDLLMARALTGLFEDWGYKVLATTDTERGAVRVVRRCRLDVVLMDIKLQDGNGLSAANLIRQSSEVPIVFCTSYAGDDAVQSAVQALGNATLIGKPFDDDDLADLLANATKKEQERQTPLA